MSNSNGSRKSPAPGGRNNDMKRSVGASASSQSATAATASMDNNTRSSSGRPMQVSSDEINVLIYRYLQEAGFVHSAFTFAYESMIGRSDVSKANVPPGALISFLQKGLQYVGIEETLRQDGSDRKNAMNGGQDIDFTLLSPLAIKALTRKNPPIKLNVPPETAAAAIKARLESGAKSKSQQQSVNPSNSNGNVTRNGPMAKPQAGHIQNSSFNKQAQIAQAMINTQHQGNAPFTNGYGSDQSKQAAAAALASFNSQQRGETSTKMEIDGQMRAQPIQASPEAEAEAIAALLAGKSQQSQQADIISQQEGKIEQEDMPSRAKPEEVLELNRHSSEVFMCAWNPIFTDLLATGSGDASARIWKMGGKNAKAGSGVCRLLQHGSNSSDMKNKDVTTLEWSSDGELLATGSYDGVARVWARTGAIVHTLRGHMGPIFSLKWNKSGNFLLSGSYDKTTIVWDVSGETGKVKQQFMHHAAPALDVDWKDDATFASCSTDKTVLICKVGVKAPLHEFRGHKDEVNAVKWDPSGTLLASCSDDTTAKVWDVSSGKPGPLHDFTCHQQEIYTVKWSPTGPGSNNPNKPKMLATASFDSTVRLWNVQSGSCIAVLSRHRESVYSVAFSPSGDYLASGSLAGQLYVWRVKDGKHIKNFKGKGDIFEVAWNKEESRIAACFSSNVVNVIDFKA